MTILRAPTLLLLALAPIMGYAANWQLASTTDAGDKFYIDGDSVAKVGKYRKAWTREEYTSPAETEGYPKRQYSGSKYLYYFDCEAGTSGAVQRIDYAGPGTSGEVVDSKSIKFRPDLLKEPAPDTVGEFLMKAACGTAASRARVHQRLTAQE